MTAKMIETEVYGKFRVALLEEDGERFFRIRTADVYEGNIERMEMDEAVGICQFIVDGMIDEKDYEM